MVAVGEIETCSWERPPLLVSGIQASELATQDLGLRTGHPSLKQFYRVLAANAMAICCKPSFVAAANFRPSRCEVEGDTNTSRLVAGLPRSEAQLW